MWVRKEPEEVRKMKRRKWLSPLVPFGIGIFCFAVCAFSLKIGYHKWIVFNDPMPWDVFFTQGLRKVSILGAIIFLLSYVWQLVFKRPILQSSVSFCEKCDRVKGPEE